MSLRYMGGLLLSLSHYGTLIFYVFVLFFSYCAFLATEQDNKSIKKKKGKEKFWIWINWLLRNQNSRDIDISNIIILLYVIYDANKFIIEFCKYTPQLVMGHFIFNKLSCVDKINANFSLRNLVRDTLLLWFCTIY